MANGKWQMANGKKFKFFAMAAILAALLTGPAQANVIYSYTGNNFTFHTSPYTATDHVSIQLEFLSALAPNLPFGAVAPVSFSFNDGHQTITSTVFGGLFQVSTNPSGALFEWVLIGCGNIGCVEQIHSHNIVGNVRDGGQLVGQGASEGIVDNNPGVWTVSVVPEPSTMAITAVGLAGLGWCRRRRLASRPTALPVERV